MKENQAECLPAGAQAHPSENAVLRRANISAFWHCRQIHCGAGGTGGFEVALGANIETGIAILAQGGSIATYASDVFKPEIPYWPLVFSNANVFFIGSDDVPMEAKMEAARANNQALEAGWQGLAIAAKFPLDEIAEAHEFVERPANPGRVIVTIS
jgi:NADPH:quinone reductase-like Zn-dependent oxidoreductase